MVQPSEGARGRVEQGAHTPCPSHGDRDRQDHGHGLSHRLVRRQPAARTPRRIRGGLRRTLTGSWWCVLAGLSATASQVSIRGPSETSTTSGGLCLREAPSPAEWLPGRDHQLGEAPAPEGPHVLGPGGEDRRRRVEPYEGCRARRRGRGSRGSGIARRHVVEAAWSRADQARRACCRAQR